jgi:hypothetical protein
MRPHDVQGVAAPIEDPVPVLPALPHPRLATRQRLTQQQIWVAQHIDLIKQAVSSTTRGEFDDRVESLLQHAPPGSTVQPCTDNTHDIAVGNDASALDADMDDATSNEAADTDDIAGISQSTVQRPDRKLQRMDRHIQHGDFNKARQALVGAAVANVGTASVRERLRSKYPPPEHPRQLPDNDLLANRSQAVDHVTICINDSDSLLAHIMAKKRGASMSTCGHSNDHYQDILRQDPAHILLILQLCNLIAIGTLTDGPARTLLLNGKGTALVKNITDVRPIVTVHPLLHYTGHAIATEYSTRIRTICGSEQFMGLPAGCEIVAHYIRSQLESDPSLVIAKVDVKNAFNEIDPAAILAVVSAHLPQVLPFADLLLAQSSMQTIFNDSRAGITSVYKMDKGVPQGGSMSSALFNMGQSTSIRRAAQLHPTVSILLIADDTHVLGTPDEVIAAIMTIRDLYAEIGLSLAATTASKNVIYGLGQHYTPAQYQLAQASDLHWIPCNLGLQIGGTPVGSFDYMVESVNKTVDAIVSELQQFERYLHGANGMLRARVQTIFAMIRQCSTQQLTHLLRTCPPATTLHATRRLDTAVANTIFRITDSNQYLPPEHSVLMKEVLNRFHLAIRLGGDGFSNTEEIRESAYVASLLQCAPAMYQFGISSGAAVGGATGIPGFDPAVASLRMKGVLCLNGISSNTIWTSPPKLRMQKLITSQLQALRRGAAQLSLPTGLPRNGPAVHQPLTPNDTAVRRQGITNLTCRDSSQWLTANPAFIFNKMSDAAFKTCYHLRHMFPVLGSRKFCICGAPTDCFGDHALVCPQITVRNQTRNTAHSDVSRGLRNALQPRSVHSGYYIVQGEPHMEDYVPRLHPVDPQAANPPNQRADIALISTSLPNPGAVTLIDVTLAAHNRQHGGPEYSVGAAAILRAREKHDMYNRTFDFSSDAVRLEVFAIETSGALHREGRQFLRSHATATDPHNPGLQFSNILKTLSVAVQTARAKCVIIARDRLTLDTAPLVPFINGLLPVPPPVRLTLPIVHVRYDALTPPPLRPAPPTAHLPPAPHFPPLPPTPSPPPLPPGTPPVSQW